MGWWPSAGSSATPSTLSDATRTPPATKETLPPKETEVVTRDQQAEAELSAFLASLESSSTIPSTSDPNQPSPSPPPVANDHSESHQQPDGTLNISPSHLRPRTMSCRQAFDQAYYCSGPAGKFNDIYRFGSLQPCTENWNAFWFCMRTKSYKEPERGDAIARYYEERETREMQRRAAGRSSEDVWRMREKPVEKAFWKRA